MRQQSCFRAAASEKRTHFETPEAGPKKRSPQGFLGCAIIRTLCGTPERGVRSPAVLCSETAYLSNTDLLIS